MELLILLVIAFGVGYWLSRSRFHGPIDKAVQQPKNWWNRLVRRPKDSEPVVEESKPE